ncbi:substrate-binding protein [Desulfogranum mediterraneum]|uniref:substrate-binding protein n=1 Tax=Desulfogranum mediterraneum TaxID=160661 RepID=UPI00040D5F8A|nr:substrate-binding protein [Desulfogranum mediterraneum]
MVLVRYLVCSVVVFLITSSHLALVALASEPVLIGLNVPLSGAYSRQGEDQLRAYRLAIKILNSQGGILGREVVYSVRDTKTKAGVARNNALDLIRDEAVMITGGSSSASAIAQAEVCQQEGVVFMAGLSHSNATTGRDGHRHSFRWFNNGHQTAKAMAGLLADKFGDGAGYVFLYADYTWGQTVQQSLQQVVEGAGARTILKMPTKLGTKSFISLLLRAQKARPDVLVLVLFGQDMINCLKQVTLLNLRSEMAVVVPLMELNMAHSLGAEVMQGVITSMPWYHGMAQRYEGSRRFVDLFEARYQKKPGSSAATAWVNIFQYAAAVERARSFDAQKVIEALEGHRFQLLGEEEYWRSWDHQGIHPTYIAVGKSPAASRDEWDLFEIISSKQGEELARSREENPVALEPFDERPQGEP